MEYLLRLGMLTSQILRGSKKIEIFFCLNFFLKILFLAKLDALITNIIFLSRSKYRLDHPEGSKSRKNQKKICLILTLEICFLTNFNMLNTNIVFLSWLNNMLDHPEESKSRKNLIFFLS